MRFKIFSPGHTLFAAKHLKEQLKRLGHSAINVTEVNHNDREVYIIYNASHIERLPGKYIVYQTEISSSHWFTPRYYKIIRDALAVWDYSESNIKKYHSFNKNIHVVTPGVARQYGCEKDIPVTFYGWIDGSNRRKQMLSQIGKKIKVNMVTNILEGDMWKILARTKVVLNVHYYDNSPLELFRINEALSFGCHVVSEPPSVDRYKELVSFENNVEQIVERVKEQAGKKFKLKIDSLDNFEEIKKAVQTI